jgi:hypothetical protein
MQQNTITFAVLTEALGRGLNIADMVNKGQHCLLLDGASAAGQLCLTPSACSPSAS